MINALQIQNKADKALEQLSHSDNWIEYLSQLGKLYRYPFKSSLLIYAQSKTINAFATYEQWNTLGRRVKRAEHGVKIIVDVNETQQIQTVFDISQTSGNEAYVWSFDRSYEKYVVDLFSSDYGLSDKMDIENAIMGAASKIAYSNMPKYIDKLEKKDDYKFVSIFESMVDLSIQHAALVRCGFEGLSHELFKYLSGFSKNDLVVLGNAVTSLTREVLSPIERKMKDENRRNSKQKDNVRYDQAGAQERLHAGDVGRESAGSLRSDRRSRTDTRGIHSDGYRGERLSPEGDRSDGNEHRQIRLDEIEPSEGKHAGHVRANDSGRNDTGTLRADRSERHRDDRDGAQEAGTSEESNDTIHRPVHTDREPVHKGTGLQLEWYDRKTEDKSLPFFHSAPLINQILRKTPHIKTSKQDIADYFAAYKDRDERTAYIKSIFNNDYTELIVGDNHRVGYKTYQNVLHLWEGSYNKRVSQGYYDWGVIAEHYASMIMLGEFLDEPPEQPLEQMAMIEQAEDNKTSAFSLPQEVIDTVLLQGSGIYNGKYRIYLQYQQNLSAKEMVDFLKNEYGIGGRAPALIGTNIHEWHDGKGIALTRGAENKIVLSWTKVQKRLGELIAADRYLSHKEKEHLPVYVQQAEERAGAVIREHSNDPERQTETAEKIGRDSAVDSYERFSVIETDEGYAVWDDLHDRCYVDDEGVTESFKSEWQANDYLNQVRNTVADKEAAEWLYAERINSGATAPVERTPHLDKEQTSASRFRITDDHLGEGGAKAKYGYNVAAIRALKQIESEGRMATVDEQAVLSRYVGWGGIAQAFDASNASWSKQNAELLLLLTDAEYSSARESTLNAHYTSPIVIKAMYKAIERTGIKTGNMLEPSCGVGNFLGLIPSSMVGVKVHGVEIDSISGRIAQQLYQNADIRIQGFETTTYPNDYFDFAVGNVPFGDYSVHDPQFNKHKFNIHDYFFAKTLDKVKPGGVIAFITSKGTMDKANNSARKYIAQRAELVGAIRLPNTAFYKNAGTQVTTDILFLQKREHIMDIEPEWIHLDKTEYGITVNSYFAAHPDMMLGRMVDNDGMYGNKDTACVPFEDADLAEQLNIAIQNIQFDSSKLKEPLKAITEMQKVIPADPSVKRFSYTLVGDAIYFRNDDQMELVETNDKQADRIKALIELRDTVREVIDAQVNDLSLEEIKQAQAALNSQYDAFVDNFGRINSVPNSRAFLKDDSYFLLCSIEVFDDEQRFVGKADIFDKLTIRPSREITHADTAIEAYGVSMARKGKIDISYMAQLTGKQPQELIDSLKGVIYMNPVTGQYESADEYLSGKVKQKLQQAKDAGDEFAVNVAALEKVQPKRLEAMDIDVKLGTIWIPEDDYTAFMHELLSTFWYNRQAVVVNYSPITGEWNISQKSRESDSVAAGQTYGTSRKSAYSILENALNQRPTKIYDTFEDNGKRVSVLNKRETMLASQKQVLIEQKFKDWIYKDQERRERLVNFYNDHFNNIRPREYDGSHIEFIGMSPEIELNEHQVNAVARQLYGGNALLAHCVGAGKTFTMIAAGMEGKRLGLWHKNMIVVPNHLTKQTAIETLRLYPSANILVTTKDDLSTKNRKKFCSKIATGDYDIVIIAHSQFERIPISMQRQEEFITREIDEIVEGIEKLRRVHGQEFNVKQMAKTKKRLESKLKKLNNTEKKDSVIMFEELGVDRLFVDESHEYKNLFVATKMNNVAGISSSESQKATDMYLKCQYLDECGNKITFSTGTPISNSMAEMYTNQRYLAMDALKERGLEHFDNWASVFGETKTAYEVNITAQGFKTTTRFARFTNIPELMNMVREFMDIQTEDMLDLDRPQLAGDEVQTITTKPSDIQKTFIEGLNERYEKLPSDTDNALCITGDGRKVAIDQRLINPLLPDEDDSKVNTLMQKVYDIYKETIDARDTQLVFCDVSTPKPGGAFSIYQDLKDKWMEKGIPENEIAFIHDAKNDIQKEALFARVRNGSVRILIGSTQKMGTGTNCQKRLIALHHLDVPWRPSDLEQRNGRIIRQGNEHEEVGVYRYVTEGTFDTYNYQLLEQKQRYISQIMTSKSPSRSAEDLDDMTLSYAEVKALATGNPHIREKMELEVEVQKLKLLKSEYQSNIYTLENKVSSFFPRQIERLKEQIAAYMSDLDTVKPFDGADFAIVLNGMTYDDKKLAGEALLKMCSLKEQTEGPMAIGVYKGLDMYLKLSSFDLRYEIRLVGQATHRLELGHDLFGNLQRIENKVQTFGETLEDLRRQLDRTREQLCAAEKEVKLPFNKEQQLTDMLIRLDEINHMLDMDKPNEHDKVVEGDDDRESNPRTKNEMELER